MFVRPSWTQGLLFRSFLGTNGQLSTAGFIESPSGCSSPSKRWTRAGADDRPLREFCRDRGLELGIPGRDEPAQRSAQERGRFGGEGSTFDCEDHLDLERDDRRSDGNHYVLAGPAWDKSIPAGVPSPSASSPALSNRRAQE